MVLKQTRVITEFVDGRNHRLCRIEEIETGDICWEEQPKFSDYCSECLCESWSVIGRDMTDTRIKRLETEYQNMLTIEKYGVEDVNREMR